MDKEDVAHIYNGILLRHKKNEIMPFTAIDMDLQSLILSEVSQIKNKYHMISPMSEILKKVVQMNLIYKIEIESQNAETKLMVTKEIKGG